MKNVFTTGEAARITKLSQQTIIRCFDSGQLKGFRVPGSRFRRIPRDELYKFMKENGIPTDGLEGDRRLVLMIDDDSERAEEFSVLLAGTRRFAPLERIWERSPDVTAARVMHWLYEHAPDVIVINIDTLFDAEGFLRVLREVTASKYSIIICFGTAIEEKRERWEGSLANLMLTTEEAKPDILSAHSFEMLDLAPE